VAASHVLTTSGQNEAPSLPVVRPEKDPAVRAWPAAMKLKSSVEAKPRSLYVPARHAASRKEMTPRATQAKAKRQERPPVILAQYGQKTGSQDRGAREMQRAYVLVIETRQTITAGANGWQLSVQQLRWLVPVKSMQKSVPSKT